MLYLTTCVGLGYGPCVCSLEAFLGSRGSPNSPHSAMHHLSGFTPNGFAYLAPYGFAPVLPLTGTATLLRHPFAYLLADRVPRSGQALVFPKKNQSPAVWVVSGSDSVWARTHGYGNINPLSIDYACRPRLRSRLTLGGLAWPRNPWSFGGQGSHLPYRYSCLHSHSPHLHRGSLHDFTDEGTLPYPAGHWPAAAASAVCLSPATLSARNHLTSELLRTLSRVAASKPTSWLSSRSHILSHLAHA